MAARRRILFICFVNALVFSKFDDLRNLSNRHKFRKGETPLIEPARAMVSPFPEGRDLG